MIKDFVINVKSNNMFRISFIIAILFGIMSLIFLFIFQSSGLVVCEQNSSGCNTVENYVANRRLFYSSLVVLALGVQGMYITFKRSVIKSIAIGNTDNNSLEVDLDVAKSRWLELNKSKKKERRLKDYYQDIICKKTGMTKTNARLVLNTLLDEITNELRKGGTVTLKNFGRFYTSEVKKRNFKNFKTQQNITVQKHRIAKFKFSKNSKKAIKGQ